MSPLDLLDGFTMRALADLLAALLLLGGLLFMFIGSIGVVRLPDGFHRIHAVSVCATLGLTGMLLGACFHIGSVVLISKAAMTIVFLFVAAPAGSHLLAKAAHDANLPQWGKTLSDELAEDKEAFGVEEWIGVSLEQPPIPEADSENAGTGGGKKKTSAA
ncbi:MAG: monovalent cation/H(+) antiporter subunit G [Phycisphaeraceae bacterium]|nr:monovalent cation/H(+) antiporter subunit G [Phycisphaeraceae bacterium]